jgi:hypothetical protein
MIKSAQIANFNVVFGDDEKPMLDYFDSIIFPAFSSNITKVVDDTEYLFKNVEISTRYADKYVLTGKIVKKTILEIKSDLNEDGELVEKDEKHPTAPYSSFAINLLNHRMIFMPNQKGSPTLVNFRSTVRYVISTYIKERNKELDEDNKLEYALINVVGIPSAHSMEDLLNNVEKVNSLTLRFYPLNGDMDYTEAFGIVTTDMRSEVGCKNGEIVFKSPKSILGIKNLLEKAAGTINPILKVVTKGKSKATLRDYELSEKYEIDIPDESDFDEESAQLVGQMEDISTLNYTNDEHNDIYDRNREKIIPFIKRTR